MDRITFLKKMLTDQHDPQIAEVLTKARRDSTVNQQQVAWSAWQNWLKEDDERSITKTDLLRFFIFLKEDRNLAPRTILNYRIYLSQPVELATGINLKDWEFKDLDKAFFLINPPTLKRVPSWSLDKVLELLKTRKYNTESAKSLDLLRKVIFLLALASGNRVSELAAIDASAMRVEENARIIHLPVQAGFRFKNKRLGRCPPDISIKSLVRGSSELCPVKTLIAYKRRMNIKEGKLLVNSRLLQETSSSVINSSFHLPPNQ